MTRSPVTTRTHTSSRRTPPAPSSGGGAKVAVIARLDPDTGAIDRGTFLVARLSSGNTNTLNATGLTISGDSVLLDVESAAWPPAAGATAAPLHAGRRSDGDYRGSGSA